MAVQKIGQHIVREEDERLLRGKGRYVSDMKLPGEAWLQWTIEPDGAGCTLDQQAIFSPRGLFGRLYWYVLIPFHALIFARMCEELAEAAEHRVAEHRSEGVPARL